MSSDLSPRQFWIDVGGTFTDCLSLDESGRLTQHKQLSSGITKGTASEGSSEKGIVDPGRVGDPTDFWVGFRCTLLDDAGEPFGSTEVAAFDAKQGILTFADELSLRAGSRYELSCHLEAPVLAIRWLLKLPLAEQVPPVSLRLGTTRGTNALLTRTGAKTALAITKGFGDLLEIGSQERPRLFDLTVRKSAPLSDVSVEIAERVTAQGEVLIAPEPEVVHGQLMGLRRAGVDSLAICFLHADLYPEHELLVERIAREVGFAEVSCSSRIAPLVKVVSRAETTLVDAYLNPVLRSYVTHLHHELPGSQIRLMTSAGGLVSAEAFRGFQSVLSGPAGGVVGYAQIARAAGYERAIGFDMGGTSTDVSRYDGQYRYEYETRKAGVRLVAPTLAIDTVAAGGGSICKFDGSKLVVGPESAGAEPGPACYGRGGPLTVTDLNLYLGRIATERFPFRLDREVVAQRLQVLADEVNEANDERLSLRELAEGLLRIANANMARAIRGVSIAEGVDPRDYLMVCFGGAGAQHACAVARELGVREILIHPHAAILSAYGIGQADVARHAAAGIAKTLEDVIPSELSRRFDVLEEKTVKEVIAEGFAGERIEIRRTVDLRYLGTDAAINLPFSLVSELKAEFEAAHRQQFGYVHEERAVEIVALRVEAVGRTETSTATSQRLPPRIRERERHASVWFDGQESEAACWDRTALQPGDLVRGPAIFAEDNSTIVVEPGWQAEVMSGGELLLSIIDDVSKPTAPEASQAVMLELFNNLFAGVAEQMGHVLRRTAGSVNVKERLDYSCALFSAAGELIANAPHVPVHLGAMGATVRAVLDAHPQMSPGDVFVTNDPYQGGSHLPDVTVVTPVHDPESHELLFFTACRAHHAEIGGVRPGSMPPFSEQLGDEGVLISDFTLIQEGVSQEEGLRELLSSGPYPSRNVEENLADIRAQVAANRQGSTDLLKILEQFGLDVVQRNVRGIQEAAERKVRSALARVKKPDCSFTDYLETAEGESVPIQVEKRFPESPAGPAAVIDFNGTSPVVAGNLNANRAIVTAAVLYVLRLLVDEDVPLNEGALRAVEIVLPECLLNPPRANELAQSPAVAAGNVETSQRVVDVLLGALDLAGASQGTMNNLLFGNEDYGYYETICGGSGATANGPGAAAVQIHMTNTRATDPEILERRHPVRLHEFSIRTGSGGEGHHQGGDGVVRRIEFLERTEVSLITGRRGPHPPYGAEGGQPGALGRNLLIRADGSSSELPGICELEANPGEALEIRTPGGGGFGES